MNQPFPIHYHISITPDFGEFRFTGTVDIVMKPESILETITLDVLALSIDRCTVRLGDKQTECRFTVNEEEEALIVTIPDGLESYLSPESGLTLSIDYRGIINDNMAGFYKSGYLWEGATHYIGVTQFEESDARRAFPCFDHPRYKATFDLELTVGRHYEAIANTPVSQIKNLPDNKKRVVFETTPKMSTYLLFFGVGDFKYTQNKQYKRIRIVTVPGRETYTSYGLRFGFMALKFCEDYFRVPYPLAKIDLIAVPDFAFGAMENWGAITFRENLLLYYPDITSRAGEKRICEVIAHEIVHQWFGNLVTPQDWKYLWLNESFATLFGFTILDHYYPEWEIWQQFIHEETSVAIHRDAFHETFPIEIPGGEHIVINASTAPIIYSKGGSILRQIKEYLGEREFSDGLTTYLQTHAYGSTDSCHLWEAMEKNSQEPVIDLMKSWIEQPGFPMITVRREENRLLLTQKRFTYLKKSSEQTWIIPLTVTIFDGSQKSDQIKIIMQDPEMEIALPDGTTSYKINSEQTGYYRVYYSDRDHYDKLGSLITLKELIPEDRWGCEDDLFAMVLSCEKSFTEYLEFLRFYREESAYLPLMSISSNLMVSYLILTESSRERIRETGRSLFESVLGHIGFQPEDNERFTTSILRDTLLYDAAFYGSEAASDFCLKKFQQLTGGIPLHADIFRSVIKAAVLLTPEKSIPWMKERFMSSESEHERLQILSAISCVSDEGIARDILGFILDNVPSRNKYIPINGMIMNPVTASFMWDWFIEHNKTLQSFHPIHYERILAALIPISGLSSEKEITAYFETHMEENEAARDTIKLSLEKLKIYKQVRMHNK
ncbi:MAG: M1 family metallopeptidase [Spirochaetales bacterium]|nr:M1 family metallopeptidase [Spirochaetales bacterium]